MTNFGISPFMKLFKHQNLIAACVKGLQYELLEWLIKDTYQGATTYKKGQRKIPPKYKVEDQRKFDYYWKSRENRDDQGNSPLHVCYEIHDLRLRYKMLTLLMEN